MKSEYRKLFDSAAWGGKNGMRKTVLNRNPVCQRVRDDGQCRNWATDVHHLRGHEGKTELFFAWDNVVALCHSCHSEATGLMKGEAGDPGFSYIATIGFDGQTKYEHKATRVIVPDKDGDPTLERVLGYSSMTEATAGRSKLTIADVLRRVREA
jgi:hypothetical protein